MTSPPTDPDAKTAENRTQVNTVAKAEQPFEIGMDPRYERLNMIGWWDQSRLTQAKIIVVGAGALGNEVVKNLALLGVGQVILVDFDTVEPSNLSRSVLFRDRDEGQPKALVAAAAAQEINPDCRVQGWSANVTTDLGLGLIQQADLVIGCVDNREARMWINRLCWKVGKPWIDGGIQELNGVVKVFGPQAGGCYECAMTENDFRLIHLRYRCPLLKQDNLIQGKVPTSPTIAAVIAGLQVQEMLKYLHGLPQHWNSAWVFNGHVNQSYQTKFSPRADCLAHERYEPIVTTQLAVADTTVEQLFSRLQELGVVGIEGLQLDRDLLDQFCCDTCHQQVAVGRPLNSVSMEESRCQQCGQWMRPESIHEISGNDPRRSRRLSELGIPDQEIVKVKTQAGTVFAWLNRPSGVHWRQ